MNDFSKILARLMTLGTAAAAAIIATGLILYLPSHVGHSPGDHVFQGEPGYFTHPIQMVRHSCETHEDDHCLGLVMAGVFLLLLTPLIRVFLAAIGYWIEGDRLYCAVSGIVFAILLVSFFW